jgi:hypothetical protein
MKEELPEEMVYIRVDIPVPTFFRDAMLEVDPEFEDLGKKLSQLIAEDFRNELTSTEASDEISYPRKKDETKRYH